MSLARMENHCFRDIMLHPGRRSSKHKNVDSLENEYLNRYRDKGQENTGTVIGSGEKNPLKKKRRSTMIPALLDLTILSRKSIK